MANVPMKGKRALDFVNLALAVCVFGSPWVGGFTVETMPSWNSWLVGVLLGALAIAEISAFSEWEEWANLALGCWLIASPWLLGFATNADAMGINVVLGILVAAVSLWSVWQQHHPHAHA